jgi:hypothetical protein
MTDAASPPDSIRQEDVPAFSWPAKDVARFWAKVKIGDAGQCWLWLKSKRRHGYGQFSAPGRIIRPAHKVAYELATAQRVPPGMLVCHRCDNPSCVNPAHLWLGSHKDNMRDMAAKGRQVTGERMWTAKLTPDKVLAIRAEPRRRGVIPYLAEKYGVSERTISRVRERLRWRHV